MSQEVGQIFKSKIPSLGDDASIEEALRVYHYGIDDYSGGNPATQSIEGHLSTLTNGLSTTNTNLTNIGNASLRRISLSSNANVVTAENISTTPLTIRSISGQTSSLQQWQNSSSSVVASISTGGYIATSNYISIGSLTAASTIALNISVASPSNKGIVVKGASSQSGNLQEWQNSAGTAIASISSAGNLNAKNTTIDGTLTVLQTISAKSPGNSTDGAIRIIADNSENSYLQFMNSANTTELANIKATSSAITLSNNVLINGNVTTSTGTVSAQDLSISQDATIAGLNITDPVAALTQGARNVWHHTSAPVSGVNDVGSLDGDIWIIYSTS